MSWQTPMTKIFCGEFRECQEKKEAQKWRHKRYLLREKYANNPQIFSDIWSDLFFVKCGREGQTKGLGSPIFADSWIVNVWLESLNWHWVCLRLRIRSNFPCSTFRIENSCFDFPNDFSTDRIWDRICKHKQTQLKSVTEPINLRLISTELHKYQIFQ